MKTLISLLFIVLVQQRPQGAGGAGEPPPAGVQVDRDVAYRDDLRLDVYRTPSTGRRPAVVYIHGGGWDGGDKAKGSWFCGMLASHDYVVFSINYRLSGEAKHPAQIEDCQSAIRWIRANADRYGVHPQRIAAIGGSAGGHLAALLGVRDGDGCRVQAVVSYFGPHDLNDGPGGNKEKPLKLIGGARDEKPDAWKDASCSTHVTADDPPVLFVHGDADRVVPLEQSEKLLKALRAKGVEAELVVVKGGDHGFMKTPGAELLEIDRKVIAFLDRHLKRNKP